MNLLCLDAEFADANEILELAVYDFDERLVYSSLFKPASVRQWRMSQRIHHISPQMVKDKPSFASCRAEIQEIFDKADFIAGFATDNDIRMLEKSGIERLDDHCIIDVRDIYWHSVARERGTSLNSVPGLAVCAADIGIEFDADTTKEHSAGGDTLVTLRCLRELIARSNPDGLPTDEALRRLVDATEASKRQFRRENARGYVHLLRSAKGYTIKPSTHAKLERDDVVATISVEHRDRAEVELVQHFAAKSVAGERKVFALRDRDLTYFKSYSNTYDEEGATLYRAYLKRLYF